MTAKVRGAIMAFVVAHKVRDDMNTAQTVRESLDESLEPLAVDIVGDLDLRDLVAPGQSHAQFLLAAVDQTRPGLVERHRAYVQAGAEKCATLAAVPGTAREARTLAAELDEYAQRLRTCVDLCVTMREIWA